MQSKRIPFAQIWHKKKKKKKKKNDPVFSVDFTVGTGEGNITYFFFGPYCTAR